MRIPEILKWKATGKTLGQGGQGVVHEVINKEEQNGKKYALKALSKGKPLEAYQRFYREIKAIKELKNTAIDIKASKTIRCHLFFIHAPP